MSNITTIRDWLMKVGAVYHISEAHHERRPDSQRRPVAPFFTFRFDSSEPRQNICDAMTRVGDGNDASVTLEHSFARRLTVSVHNCEDGVEVLEALAISHKHPDVSPLLSSGGVVIIRMVGVTNESTFDDKKITYQHSVIFDVRLHTTFSTTRTDLLFDSFSLTGEYTHDSGATIDVVVEGDV